MSVVSFALAVVFIIDTGLHTDMDPSSNGYWL